MTEKESFIEEAHVDKMLDLIKSLAPVQTTNSNSKAKPSSGNFEHYVTHDPNLPIAPVFVEYVNLGVMQEKGRMFAQIIQMIFVHETEEADYSISKVIAVKKADKKMSVFNRYDSTISPAKGQSQDFYGEIPPKIARLLPKNSNIDPGDAVERKLTNDEIEEEIEKAQKLEEKW